MNELTIPEKKVFGVCSWIANKFDFDVSIIRAVFVITTIFGVGSPVLLYFALALIKYFIK